MISVFTPTHKGTYLKEAYESLTRQTHKAWEWVVCPNGPNAASLAAQLAAFNDDRVKVHTVPGSVPPYIGSLKRFACDHCGGELFFELDHDDWLTDDCLAKVQAVYDATKAGFIYTESLDIPVQGVAKPYSKIFGWKHKVVRYGDRDHVAHVNFDVTPRSLAHIYYAPNHARVWSRDAYYKAGGHAPMVLCDDHDLMCRTYIAGVEFASIPEVLYYQRRHPEAASIKEQNVIGGLTEQVCTKYLTAMAEEWCRRNDLMKLDLGGVHNAPADRGYKTVDFRGADINCDLRLSLPVPDNSVGIIRAHDFLEHIAPEYLPSLFNRLYNKLANFGWLFTHTPAVSDNEGRVGRGAYQDPTHRSFWSSNNFWYYTDANFAKYVPELKCRFQTVQVFTHYPSKWHEFHHIPYVQWDGMCVKGDVRVPGRMLI